MLSMFPSIHHLCQKQSHEKKRWSSLDYWNCKWDLNHALDMSAKENENKSTQFFKHLLEII